MVCNRSVTVKCYVLLPTDTYGEKEEGMRGLEPSHVVHLRPGSKYNCNQRYETRPRGNNRQYRGIPRRMKRIIDS